jgi:hypothetical protein
LPTSLITTSINEEPDMRNHRIPTKSRGIRLICALGLIVVYVSGPIISGKNVSPVTAQSASTQRAEALVLVNSNSANYTDFQRYLQPYLNHFGVPYTVLDIATTAVSAATVDYAVILIGHRQLDVNLAYLSAAEQTNIVNAVNGGSGLVNFDNDLSANGSTARYAYVANIFGFGYVAPPTASSLTFSAVAHYITERHSAGEVITTMTPMTLAGITLPPSATALATSGTQPFLAITTSGAGRAVQWGTTNWMSHAVKGPMYGLDDLVWRSIVWAARKPFVMQGMPPFVTMRIDDVSGPMDWIHIANEVGFKPWAGVFLYNIDEAEAAELASLSQAVSATVGIHAFTDTLSFYYNQYNGDYPDAVMAANYVTGTQWFTSHGITPSKYVAFHHYEAGTNAFAGLSSWGVKYVATHQLPGQPEYWPFDFGWLPLGPYRLYESFTSTLTTPVYYADYLPIPNHPEYTNQFFNCVTEVRDEQVYEWIPSNDVTASVLHGTRQLQRGLDGMAVPTLFAHQYNLVNITNASWRSIMQGIASNIAPYQPQYVTMDYACQYARAMYTSSISTSVFNSGSGQITTTLSGRADIITRFYLFTESAGQIQHQFTNVPQFNGSTQVVGTYGSGKQAQTIDFAPLANKTYGDPPFGVTASATSGLTVTFTASGPCTSSGLNGATITLTGAGGCTVTAHQGGNDTYHPAPDVPQTFLIARALPTVVVTGGTATYDGQPHAATGSAYGIGGVTLTPPLTFTYNGLTSAPVTADVYSVGGYYAGNSNYLPQTNTTTLTITKATPVITWSTPADIVYGTPLGTAQLNASASAPGNFMYTPVSGTVLNAGDWSLHLDFTPGDTVNYLAASQEVSLTVMKAPQAIDFAVLPDKAIIDPPFSVTATASSGLPVAFTASGACGLSGTTVTLLGLGACTITAQQAGTANYQPASSVARTFAIRGVRVFLPVIVAHRP